MSIFMKLICETYYTSSKLEILSRLQSLSAVQYPEADAVLDKLGAIFQTCLTDWIDVDFSRWGSVAENENRLFRLLKQAIFENHEITFDYHNSAGDRGKRNVPDDMLGRIMSFCSAIVSVALPIGILLYGCLYEKFINHFPVIMFLTSIAILVIGFIGKNTYRHL